MMVAKPATWSYLKRAWGNDLKFERASRSLAKTGLCFVCFSFFLCFFSVRFFGVLEGTFGVRRVLWVSFGTHFGVIFVTF